MAEAVAVQEMEVKTPSIRFDRNELSGAFGDIGTDFPLIVGMILAAKLDPASTLILFGVMQVLTGLLYGMPMPAQPLKAMARKDRHPHVINGFVFLKDRCAL